MPIIYDTIEGMTSLVDITNDSVNASALAEGYTAHNSHGEAISGQLKLVSVLASTEIHDAVQAGWLQGDE